MFLSYLPSAATDMHANTKTNIQQIHIPHSNKIFICLMSDNTITFVSGWVCVYKPVFVCLHVGLSYLQRGE